MSFTGLTLFLVLLTALGNCQDYNLPNDEGGQIKFSGKDIKFAIKEAQKLDKTRKENEKHLEDEGLTSDILAPLLHVAQLDKHAISVAKKARFAQDVINSLTKLLYERLMEKGMKALPNIDKPEMPKCNGEKYRRYRKIDGKCNNLKFGLWGTPFTAQRRLLPADYGPDEMTPKFVSRTENAKTISQKLLHSWKTMKDSRLSAMAMQFGQFLNHDISFTPVATLYDSKTKKPKQVKCCSNEGEKYFEDCFPIRMPKSDWFFKKYNVDCIDFIRSAPAFNERNGVFTYGTRQQMNQVTSFIDGSQIYGSNADARNELVDFKTGYLKTSKIHKKNNYLPQDKSEHCDGAADNSCFKAGDSRVNTQLNLMVMHTIFMREHNRIASFFANNTKWSGRHIFEESRRILGAFLQVITYNEYLPAILNSKILRKYELDVSNKRTKYHRRIDPSIYNEFSTAAFRFGHSQVYHKLSMADSYGDLGAKVKLTDSYFNPDQMYDRYSTIQEYVLGLFYERSLATDNEISSSLTRNLFIKKGDKYGQDLGAINVQRGRDHGLPSYGRYRKMLNGRADFKDVMSKKNIMKLKQVYENLENVELYIGGLFENPLNDSAVGDTFNHMIASQFKNLMFGDRYFYSHKNTGKIAFSSRSKHNLRFNKIFQVKLMN